jgi:hypothetical protein
MVSLMETKCPRQNSFIKSLSRLFVLRDDSITYSENSEIIEEYHKELYRFVNLWCPTYLEIPIIDNYLTNKLEE